MNDVEETQYSEILKGFAWSSEFALQHYIVQGMRFQTDDQGIMLYGSGQSVNLKAKFYYLVQDRSLNFSFYDLLRMNNDAVEHITTTVIKKIEITILKGHFEIKKVDGVSVFDYKLVFSHEPFPLPAAAAWYLAECLTYYGGLKQSI